MMLYRCRKPEVCREILTPVLMTVNFHNAAGFIF
jgi:hypothetical protein